MKNNREKVISTAKNLFFILCGNTLYALAVALFVLPNGLITGGTTGLGLVAYHVFQIPLSVFVGIFNTAMFLLGLGVLGKMFALTTVISSFYYPFILAVFQNIFQNVTLTQNPMLATVFAGLMIGAGIGIVIRAGASTGGMDIPPLVLNKKLHIPISLSMYVFDCAILLLQAIFSSTEGVLYGLLLVLLYVLVLNKTLVIGKSQMQMKIISQKSEEISEAIQTKMDRGITLFKSAGGYKKQDQDTVLTIVSNRELSKITDLVMEIDPHAFLVINQVNEVRGRGFTLPKQYPDQFQPQEDSSSPQA